MVLNPVPLTPRFLHKEKKGVKFTTTRLIRKWLTFTKGVGRGGRELAEQGHRALPWGEGNPASGLEWRSSVDIDAGEVVAPRRGGDAVPLPVQGTDRQWVRHGSMPVLRVHL